MLKKQQEMFPLAIVGREPKWAKLFYDALLTAQNDLSERTKFVYFKQMQAWELWCVEYDHDPQPPIDAQVFWAHLEWLKQNGYAKSSIRLRIDAVSVCDARARTTPTMEHPTTLAQHPAIKAWWKGYVRSKPPPPGRAPFVTREQLSRIVGAMYARRRTASRTMHDARNRALFCLGYLGAFRREELARLTIGQLERTSRGLYVRWSSSKGDQTGLGDEVLILPQAEIELCAIDAWDRWFDLYKADPLFQDVPPPETPAFCVIKGPRVTATPLTPTMVYKTVVRCAAHAGVKMSPHSLRASFATHALEVHEESEVQHHGRWRNRSTMDPYIRRSRAWKKNPTRGLSHRET